MKKSNISKTSNVYILNEEDMSSDKNFQAQIRGKENLKKMLIRLSGKGWIKGHVSVDNDLYRLTPTQREEYETDSYCAIGNKSDKVFGLVRKEDVFEIKCRCEKEECHRFSECRPDYIRSQSGHQKSEAIALKGEETASTLDATQQSIRLHYTTTLSRADLATSITIVIDEPPPIPTITPVLPEPIHPTTPVKQGIGDAQKLVIEGDPTDKLLVLAGPGTGKTHCVIEKLKHMVNIGGLEADSILLLCYTRAAVKEIRSRLSKEVETGDYTGDLAYIDIRTFDSFASLVLMHQEYEMNNLGYDERIETATKAINSNPDILENCRHLVVDEIQDLVGVRAKLVKTIVENLPVGCGFTLLGDHLQGIYDYQVRDDPSKMSAQELLEWVNLEYLHELKTERFLKNYRHSVGLKPFATLCRSLLESGNKVRNREFLEKIMDLPSSGKPEKFVVPPGQDSVAVLCRSNGEVLKISSSLRARQIEHIAVRNNAAVFMPAFVTDILRKWDGSINREQFYKFFGDRGYGEPEATYRALLGVQNEYYRNQEKNNDVLEKGRLVKALATGTPLPDEIYVDAQPRIIVSTIHQAKGREYERVYMTCRNLDRISDNELLEEAKVYYVGITRARTKLATIEPVKGCLARCKKSDERWYELRGTKTKKRVIAIEVGRSNDINEISFVNSHLLPDPEDNQDYIRQQVIPGDVVELDRSPEGLYHILHNGNTIGSMSMEFSRSISEIMKEVWGRNAWSRPQTISNLYIDQICSIVKKPETLPAIVKKPYLDGYWYGVCISGLGKVTLYMDRKEQNG